MNICTAGQLIWNIFFFFGESFVLLTAKRIVLAVIDVETYGPNFWKWFDGFRLRIALLIPKMQIH